MKYPVGTRFTKSELPGIVWTKKADGKFTIFYGSNNTSTYNFDDEKSSFLGWTAELPKERLFDKLYLILKS